MKVSLQRRTNGCLDDDLSNARQISVTHFTLDLQKPGSRGDGGQVNGQPTQLRLSYGNPTIMRSGSGLSSYRNNLKTKGLHIYLMASCPCRESYQLRIRILPVRSRIPFPCKRLVFFVWQCLAKYLFSGYSSAHTSKNASSIIPIDEAVCRFITRVSMSLCSRRTVGFRRRKLYW